MTMTIDEAMDRLNGLINIRNPKIGERDWDALQLGIQALRSVRQDRVLKVIGCMSQLPGETTNS